MMEDIDKISFAYDVMSRTMSPFCQITAALVYLTLPTRKLCYRKDDRGIAAIFCFKDDRAMRAI